eukprot:m.6975 g.6975  ORF g.6975 m.6975 type:complete len:200 (-) comp3619_c0_seq2:1054-1653(-)
MAANMAVIAAVLILSFCTESAAQGCYSPVQWEGREVVLDQHAETTVEYEFTYDAKYRRIRRKILQFSDNLANRTKDTVIQLFEYKGGTQYTINEKTGECTKASLEYEFPVISTADTDNVGNFTIGALAIKDGNLPVSVWTKSQNNQFWQGIFTRAGCIPLKILTSSTEDKTKFVNTEYFDVVEGISDPDVFLPPRSCPL